MQPAAQHAAARSLVPFSLEHTCGLTAVSASLAGTDDDSACRLVFTMSGDVSGIKRAPRAPISQGKDLWRTTCFELFCAPDGGEAYWEFNFAPSGQWDAFHFSAERRLEKRLSFLRVTESVFRQDGSTATFAVTFDLGAALGFLPTKAKIGLTAVIEAKGGAKSFWARTHRRDQPDFHDRRSFITPWPGGREPR